jgi:hypothetical protein
MEKQIFNVGMCVGMFCAVCNEERGHVVDSVNKLGKISRVGCPKCGTRSIFKNKASISAQRSIGKAGLPYDRTRTYRAGEAMMHPTFGQGEVVTLIVPQKIDVLFSDRVRRLVHGCAKG